MITTSQFFKQALQTARLRRYLRQVYHRSRVFREWWESSQFRSFAFTHSVPNTGTATTNTSSPAGSPM